VTATGAGALAGRVDALLDRRGEAGGRFFDAEAGRIADLCRAMAARFGEGGRLLALAGSPQARSDARHVAVEFVHPVIVGKRALPAVALVREAGPPADQVAALARPQDVAMAFGAAAETVEALAAARSRGCLTVGLETPHAEWSFAPPSADPFVRQELAETLYHVVWELVHVFLDHSGGSAAGAGASAFLYPFLEAGGTEDAGALRADVRRSVEAKAREAAALRAQTLTEGRDALVAAARAVRAALDAGGKLLAFGNGGSATDAMDLVADLTAAPQGWPARAALDLAADPAILTALANDVGPEVLFQRQVIAYGEPPDVALGLSTSGSSPDVVAALAEGRRRGLGTVAFVGYDGGRIAAEGLADHVIVSRSEHIPRIQEAQAAAYHVLRELIELAG
jgi:D-sedoheptulose 7-phosphate isomerase